MDPVVSYLYRFFQFFAQTEDQALWLWYNLDLVRVGGMTQLGFDWFGGRDATQRKGGSCRRRG